MAMGRRKQQGRTPEMWIATHTLPTSPGHPFYQQLNRALDVHGFDEFVEAQCAPFYADTIGRPSLRPGRYFRLLLIGYFEGLDSERGMAWRTADSLSLRAFLGLGLDETTPEHSTISRTRRLIDLETHRAVFTWVLQVLAQADLVRGLTVGIDATTLEANAALRSMEVPTPAAVPGDPQCPGPTPAGDGLRIHQHPDAGPLHGQRVPPHLQAGSRPRRHRHRRRDAAHPPAYGPEPDARTAPATTP